MASDFERALQADIERLEADIAGTVIETATELAAQLRERTPVDTGHARANWVPSIGRPFDGVQTGAGEGRYNRGVAELLSYTLDDGDVYVSNNVKYVPIINAIHPTTPGFVEAAIEATNIEMQKRAAK